MPENFDEIPIHELLIFDGNELIFDGSDPNSYIVIQPGMSADEMFAALGWLEQDAAADGDDEAEASAL